MQNHKDQYDSMYFNAPPPPPRSDGIPLASAGMTMKTKCLLCWLKSLTFLSWDELWTTWHVHGVVANDMMQALGLASFADSDKPEKRLSGYCHAQNHCFCDMFQNLWPLSTKQTFWQSSRSQCSSSLWHVSNVLCECRFSIQNDSSSILKLMQSH